MKLFQWMVLILILWTGTAEAQFLFQGEGKGANSIMDKLGGTDGQALRMGWLLPGGRLLLDGQFQEVSVYSNAPKVLTAKLKGPLDAATLAGIRKQYCMPCGEPPAKQNAYFEYQVQGASPEMPQRVLVTAAPLPDATLGFTGAKRTKFLLKKAAGILGIKKGQLHRYLYLQTPDGKYCFSFHAFYDPKTKLLKRTGRMLEKRGVLMATDASDYDPKMACDGCPVPTYGGSLDSVFKPIDLIDTSALPCPLVLEDTSTVEGKALSLVTYDMDGVKSEARAYEYVVNCCSK